MNLCRWLKVNTIAKFNTIEWIYVALIALAIIVRLWDLNARSMHYDESIHLYYSWKLAETLNFQHSPWMHGPFQIEMVALFIKFIGDSAFIARLPYALFGVILVALPYFIKNYIGAHASILISLLYIFSPVVSYFSRFGRNDILIITLTLLLLIIFYKYITYKHNKYLYLTAILLALLLSIKETAYFVIFFVAVIALVFSIRPTNNAINLNIRNIYNHLYNNVSFGFFIFTLSLVLPHGAAIVSIPARYIGIELATPAQSSDSVGQTGLPALSTYQFNLGLLAPSFDIYCFTVGLLLLGGYVCYVIYYKKIFNYIIPLLIITAIGVLWIVLGNGISIISHIIPVNYLHNNTIDLNYAIAIFTVLILLGLGAFIGLLWHRSVWLVAFILFYTIWILCYTTAFTNFEGIFTGIWQSLGYWMAQQEVARGSQPWYYYIVGLSLYELGTFSLGLIGAAWLMRRGGRFNVIMASWALFSLFAYTLAKERMPWLMINIITPLIICAGIYTIHWLSQLKLQFNYRFFKNICIVPILLILLLWIVLLYDRNEQQIKYLAIWMFALIFLPLFIYAIFNIYKNQYLIPQYICSMILCLFLISAIHMFRVTYTYDDSNIEMLAYAQGSIDVKNDYYKYNTLDNQILIDNELWYPFQWYTRNDSNIKFSYFCNSCELNDLKSTHIYIIGRNNIPEHLPDSLQLAKVSSNLLWSTEHYKRNMATGYENNKLWGDIQFFLFSIWDQDTRNKILQYFLWRQQDSDWFHSSYSIYINKLVVGD